MRLRLRYTNVGNQKLILYKGHDFFFQTKIRSATGNDLGPYDAGPYEVWFVNSRYYDEEFEPIDQPSPGEGLSLFVTWRRLRERDDDQHRCHE
jgi:hypothetical protein